MEDVIGLSLQPIMFLLLFTYVFGGAIAHGSTHTYLQYELPGLLVMTVVFATLGTGLMLNQDISSGVFDRFRSLPIARWAPLAGAVLGDMVRYLISVAITIGFGMILGFRVTTNPVSAIAACLLLMAFALAMCWVSALIGVAGRVVGPDLPGQRAGRDDTPGVQGEQSEQNPQLATTDVDRAPRLVAHLKRA